MRIGIDARLYTQTGVGRYLQNLIRELSSADRDNEYIVYVRKHEFDLPKPTGKNWKKTVLDVPWHTLEEQFFVPRALAADRLDVAHFPYFNVPVLYPGPYLLTIHDLIVDHFDTGRASTLPAPLYRIKRLAYRMAMTRGIRRASAISVISETTRNEVRDHYAVPAKRLTVTYDALDTAFRETAKRHTVRKRYPFRYILYVGNAYPHKNLETLLYALHLVREKSDIRLVLAGNDGYFYPRLTLRAKMLGLSPFVTFFGNADDRDLVDLYTHATCLVFPSLMEGFGLPTFEALVCGCLPVISDIPVFREIWGKDLPLFDPNDPEDMAVALSRCIRMPGDEYARRVKRAARRIDRYDWRTTARQTRALYEKIAAS